MFPGNKDGEPGGGRGEVQAWVLLLKVSRHPSLSSQDSSSPPCQPLTASAKVSQGLSEKPPRWPHRLGPSSGSAGVWHPAVPFDPT